jgi:hypothetical protein
MTRQTAAIRTRRPSRLAAWATWVLCVTFVLLGLTPHASVQADERQTDLAAQVASAYVYKFASFIDWPDDTFVQPDSPLVIGVMGADALADVMAANLAGRQSNRRKLIVKSVHPGDALQGVHMLYLGNLPKTDLVAIYARLKGRPVLTITESAEAFALGSMINLVLADDRLRFEIALNAVGASRLKVSALMLAAAYRVKRGGA